MLLLLEPAAAAKGAADTLVPLRIQCGQVETKDVCGWNILILPCTRQTLDGSGFDRCTSLVVLDLIACCCKAAAALSPLEEKASGDTAVALGGEQTAEANC